MNIPGFIDLRNRLNIARWTWRWHHQGGGFQWRARDLEDHRTDAERAMGQSVQLRVMQARRELSRGKVVNLAVLRIQRGKARGHG